MFAGVSVVGGYRPLGSRDQPAARDRGSARGRRDRRFPCFTNPAKPFRFLAGDPLEPGPFGIMQPAKRHPVVEPDLVLVPLIAVDGAGTRLGRGKGHYDRRAARLKRSGARLIGVGWPMQRLTEAIIPSDAWDVPLDGFVCPDGLSLFGGLKAPSAVDLHHVPEVHDPDRRAGLVRDLDPMVEHEPPVANAFGGHFACHARRTLQRGCGVGHVGALLIPNGLIVEQMEEIARHGGETRRTHAGCPPYALATATER